MRLEENAVVVLRVVSDGDPAELDCDLAHIARSEWDSHDPTRRGGFRRTLESFTERGTLPLSWPSLCGLTGWAYHRDGFVREIRLCPVCVAAANRAKRDPRPLPRVIAA